MPQHSTAAGYHNRIEYAHAKYPNRTASPRWQRLYRIGFDIAHAGTHSEMIS
jgi:hypothetical protein